MTKLILAHCGTGKSYCAKMQPERFLDLFCVPYKYMLEDCPESGEAEAMKAAYSAEMLNPEYPRNYLAALKEHLKLGQYEYVLVPPDMRVVCWLEIDEIPYTLVYPERELKDEYEQRFLSRGNSEEFLDVFIGGWDSYMNLMDHFEPETRIRLRRGQYLSDVL